MCFVAAIVLFALTRAEIVERFRAPPVTQVEGLVQVYADCPADMRREYQLPVAGCVSGVVRALYRADMRHEERFREPGIVVHIGSVRTNVTDVVVTTAQHSDGTPFTRIRLPAPAYSDVRALKVAAARGYLLAVRGVQADDAAALAALRAADPALRVADARAALAAWRDSGSYSEGRNDEDYLRLLRKVMTPGAASREDAQVFAARLMLYPPYYAMPFAGGRTECSFAEAIPLSRRDPVVRLVALRKATEVVVFGGGRGEAMGDAAAAYAAFLRALAAGKSTGGELVAALAHADSLLASLLETKGNEDQEDHNR